MKNKSLIRVFIISVLTSLILQSKIYAQNLLDLQGWTVGQGSSGVFSLNGLGSENIREWGDGPQGKRVILWKAKPEGNSNNDGGWDSHLFSVENTKMYRFSVWLKKTNSNDGTSYLGCRNDILNLDGSPNNNPYFWYGDLPQLNKWYLVIGYIHGSGDASVTNYGGIYDGTTGTKIINITDFKFSAVANQCIHRSYLYYDPNINDEQYFYAPRVEVVNGNEPTIAALLGLQSITSEQAYFSGKVGIKTSDPGDYDLAVNGKIRAKEVKIEATNWPDYVFAKGYDFPSLKETEAYIKQTGHLRGIPSAKEVKANGIDVGEMNVRLLEKIEELTLHLIEIQNESKEQKKLLLQQGKEIAKLKSLKH